MFQGPVVRYGTSTLIVVIFLIVFFTIPRQEENGRLIPVDIVIEPNMIKNIDATSTQETLETSPSSTTTNVSVVETSIEEPVETETKKPQAKAEFTTMGDGDSVGVAQESAQTFSFNEINLIARDATVNILCTSKTGGLFHPLSGSGMIIDPRGVILTNAHVAQYFLLNDYISIGFIDCVIRSGNPAKPLWRAKPLYISEKWIDSNSEQLLEIRPEENGVDDFAFLIITEGVGSTDLPKTFPFVQYSVSNNKEKVGDSVLLSSYPAGFIGGVAIQRNLYLTSTITEINGVYTFDTEDGGSVDLLSLGGNILAQHGSSGGGVIGADATVRGIIVTSTDAEFTDGRDLRAITIEHINRSFEEQVGQTLDSFFIEDPLLRAENFGETIGKILSQKLIDVLEK